MKVIATISQTTLEGDYDNDVDGIVVECGRCGHTVDVFGSSDASEKRGCVMLSEECPKGENNFYAAE